MSLVQVNSLRTLFSMEPFTLLLAGSHCTVYVEPTGVRVKDDVNHLVDPVPMDPSIQDQMRTILAAILGKDDELDVAVNGREFAITRFPDVVQDGVRGAEYIVAARHRLHKDASEAFKAKVLTTV